MGVIMWFLLFLVFFGKREKRDERKFWVTLNYDEL